MALVRRVTSPSRGVPLDTKITPQVLDQIASHGYRYYCDHSLPRGLDNKQFVTLSYLKAIEIKLGVKFDFDLPKSLETISDDD